MRSMLAAVIAAVLVAGACSGGGSPGVSVEVVDEAGSPIPEVRLVVRARGPSGLAEVVGSGLTDEDGVLTVPVFEPGDYVVLNLHVVGEPPCWWGIPDTEVTVGNGTAELRLEASEVCT